MLKNPTPPQISTYTVSINLSMKQSVFQITFWRALTKASQSRCRASVSFITMSLPWGAVFGMTLSASSRTFLTLGSPSIFVATMS